MQEPIRLTKIKGNSLVIILWTAAYMAVFLFALSFAVMGTAFGWLFKILLILALPLTLTSFLVILPLNRFAFDDENKRIVKFPGQRIPYEKIQAIQVRERWGRSAISVRTGWVKRRWLADGLNKNDAAQALAEFGRRFPEDFIHRKTYSTAVLTLLVVLVAAVFAASYGGFLYFFSQKTPHQQVQLEKKALPEGAKTRRGTRYEVAGFLFLLPKQFKQVGEKDGWRTFEEARSSTRLQAGPGESEALFAKHNQALQLITGVRNNYELYRLTFTSRYGVIPMLLKKFAYRDLHDIRAYEFERGVVRGLILEGRKNSEAFADILVSDIAAKNEIHFFLTQQGTLNEAFLEALLNSLKPGA